LDESVTGVGLAVAVGVGEDGDFVTGGGAVGIFAIIDALGDPDAALGVDVHVRRIIEQRGLGPEGDFEALGHGEHVDGD
jgi:hypothetical protein